MSFESFDHVLVTEEFLRHVWEGEEDLERGGHRPGVRRFSKTEFPAHWTFEDMQQAILRTLAFPQFLKVWGKSVVCEREVDKVIIRVILWEISGDVKVHAAYPVCGEGVYRNDLNGRVALPLDLYKWEA